MPSREIPMIKVIFITLALALATGPGVSYGKRPADNAFTVQVDRPSYVVAERTFYSIAGAPPNSVILWSSWKDDVSTGEVDVYYGHQTDASGNWSALADPWQPSHVGAWRKQARIAGQTASATFRVEPRALTPFTSQVGIYHWGGTPSLNEGVTRIAGIGGRNAHAIFSVDCAAQSSLTQLAGTADSRAAFGNPNINVFMLTAYDKTICRSAIYVDPQFYTPENTAAVEGEYSDFTLYLHRTYRDTGKRFIVSHWEGDNAVYCSAAYRYATDPTFRADCDRNFATYYRGVPSPNEALRGLKLWLAARQRGIADGRARAAEEGIAGVEVFHAAEFNIVHALQDAGFPSVLYDVVPTVPLDFVSYSAYESVNPPGPIRLESDLDLIQSVTGSRNIIIGEFGFSRQAFADDFVISRTDAVLAAARSWGVPYIFHWVLIDDNQFGLFNLQGLMLPIGQYYKGRFEAP